MILGNKAIPNTAFFQDHIRSGGAARAAGRWAGLLRERGENVVQVAGDESPKGGHLLTGKPARGLGRVAEWFTGKGGRKATVEAKLHSLLQTIRPERIWFHNIAGGGKWGWSEEGIGKWELGSGN